MADTLIVDIEKRFASGVVIDANLSTEIGAGAVLVLFGPSGAGKTTIVRAIAGLERPERGHIHFGRETWFDSEAGGWVEPQARGVGYVGQDSALFPHMTVRENIEYGLKRERQKGWTAGTPKGRVDDMVALLELGGLEHRYPGELSSGQARRGALARALARRPRLLLLDEPFTALDGPARTRLRSTLGSVLRHVATSALVVTHDRTDAIALGDKMAVVTDGRVRQIGSVEEVFRRPADIGVAQTVGVESVVAAHVERVANGLVELKVGHARLRASDADFDRTRTEVFACIRAEDVMLQRDTSSASSARNHLPGRVVGIDPEGSLERLTVDCGFPLVALITRSAREEMSLTDGTPIVAVVKATAVHLV